MSEPLFFTYVTPTSVVESTTTETNSPLLCASDPKDLPKLIAIVTIVATALLLSCTVFCATLLMALRVKRRPIDIESEEPSVIVEDDESTTPYSNSNDKSIAWQDFYDVVPPELTESRGSFSPIRASSRTRSSMFPSIGEDSVLSFNHDSGIHTPSSSRASMGSLGRKKKTSSSSNTRKISGSSHLRVPTEHMSLTRLSSHERVDQLTRYVLNNENVELFRPDEAHFHFFDEQNAQERRRSSTGSGKSRKLSMDYLLSNFLASPPQNKLLLNAKNGSSWSSGTEGGNSSACSSRRGSSSLPCTTASTTLRRSVTAMSLNSPIPVLISSPQTTEKRLHSLSSIVDKPDGKGKQANPKSVQESKTSGHHKFKQVTRAVQALGTWSKATSPKEHLENSKYDQQESVTSLSSNYSTLTSPPPATITPRYKKHQIKSSPNPSSPIHLLMSTNASNSDLSFHGPTKHKEGRSGSGGPYDTLTYKRQGRSGSGGQYDTLTYRRQRRTGVHFSQDIEVYNDCSEA